MQRLATAIEVEVRFLITHATRRQLQKLIPAAALERRRLLQYSDTYYDTIGHSLMLSDNWLRKREREWQLKHAIAGFKSQEHSSGTYQYRETVGQSEILEHLKTTFPDVFGRRELSIDQMVTDGTLVSMAEFSTDRESYAYDDGEGEVRIDLDRASFGYAVGEVEVMVQSEEEIAAARARVRAIASRLAGELPVAFEVIAKFHPKVQQKFFRQLKNFC